MSTVTVAATQMACSWDLKSNLDNAESLVVAAAKRGAQIILIQELFATPYFCIDQLPEHFELAEPLQDSKVVRRFAKLAKKLRVVLPISFFERANRAYFNSVAIADADGELLGLYRKSHIPDGPGYQEKYYFNAGDTGFKTWQTRYARIGVGICWDQWFPECARAMAVQGADVLFYPTAIGSEPQDTSIDSRDHWQRTMQGHAAANMTPLVASNRIGREVSKGGKNGAITFYGSSFIADPAGAKLQEADRDSEAVLTASFNLDALRVQRASWGFFRDRRPDLYGAVGTLDGGRQTADGR
jgi:N-carbamoylputrescine amidase